MGETITILEATQRTPFTAAYLRRLCKRGFFPSAKQHGKVWLLDEDDLKLLANRRKPGRPPEPKD